MGCRRQNRLVVVEVVAVLVELVDLGRAWVRGITDYELLNYEWDMGRVVGFAPSGAGILCAAHIFMDRFAICGGVRWIRTTDLNNVNVAL